MTAVSGKSTGAVNRRTAWKILLTVVGLGGAMSGVLWASLGEGAEYYKHVDEARSSQDRTFSASGCACTATWSTERSSTRPGRSTTISPGKQGAARARHHERRFPRHPARSVQARRRGHRGWRAGNDGMLRSDRIETKCPSKYETQAGKP
jgi:hypothetical protein